MLLRKQFKEVEHFAFFKLRQCALIKLIFVAFIPSIAIDRKETREPHDRSSRSEPVIGFFARINEGSGSGIDIDGGAVENRGGHLTGNEALPDQCVDLELLRRQERFDAGWVTMWSGRPNRLV